MKKSFLILFVTLLTNCFSYVVGGYFENWAQYRSNPDYSNYKTIPSDLNSYTNNSGVTNIFYYGFASFRFGYDELNTSIPNYVNPGYKDHGAGDWRIYPFEWNDWDPWNPTSRTNGHYLQAIDLKSAANPVRKVILSIGGWNFCTNNTSWYSLLTHDFFNQMAANSTYRTQFIQSCVDFCTGAATINGTTLTGVAFDGIDIDWEFPGATRHSGTVADFQNFYNLIKALSTALHAEGKLLTAALPAIMPTDLVETGTYTPDGSGSKTINKSNPASYYEFLADVAKHLDYVNIMAYDVYGAGWSSVTADNAPLETFQNLDSIAEALQNYITAFTTVSGDITKLLLGIPAYGRTFQGVSFPSTWDSNNPYGPGCAYSGADAGGPMTTEAGLMSYVEIVNLAANASVNQKPYFTKINPYDSQNFSKSYSSTRNNWMNVLKDSSYYSGAKYNPNTKTWYAYNNYTGKWVSFDAPSSAPFMSDGNNTSSVVEKINLMKSLGLGGAFIWAVDEDIYVGNPTNSIKQTIVDTILEP
jgi:chitinase